ncbi:MAG: hypothetical protein K2Q03_04995 [Sphingobacteriaceae bacterium]|nr:hypothetical protein [Sphingobacteriaceae bacterium]
MEGINYLKKGDLAKVAIATGYSRAYVYKIAKEVYQCSVVEDVIKGLIRQRQQEVQTAINNLSK